MPERLKTSGLERNEGIAKIEQYIEQATNAYRVENIPVGNDGRIDMEAYRNFYPDVDKDLARNQDWEQGWFEGISPEEIPGKRRAMEGEQLEMLAYAIFMKNLPEKFVVARTSSHDDRANKVDNVILYRTTGTLVCAFDEVGDTNGSNYEKKLGLVRDRNLNGGASLKYGIGMVEKDGEMVVAPSAAGNIPIFYIALPPDRIRKGVQDFIPGDGQSDFEKKLFTYFMATISAQIEGLELYHRRLDPQLKEKLTAFKDIVASLAGKKQQ